jgi:PKD repeat protein
MMVYFQGVLFMIPPIALFQFSPESGPTPLAVQFIDTSLNDPTSWYWEFGDGTTSSEQDPEHTYVTPGEYTITLTVTNDHGTHTLTHEMPVTAIDPRPVVSGVVYDVTSNHPVVDAWVTIGDATTTTDGDGRYSMTVPVAEPDPNQIITCTAGSYMKNQKAQRLEALQRYTIDFPMWYTPAIINKPRRR